MVSRIADKVMSLRQRQRNVVVRAEPETSHLATGPVEKEIMGDWPDILITTEDTQGMEPGTTLPSQTAVESLTQQETPINMGDLRQE